MIQILRRLPEKAVLHSGVFRARLRFPDPTQSTRVSLKNLGWIS